MPRSKQQPTRSVADWRDRILPVAQAIHVVAGTWQHQAYEQYRARLLNADYPCFFGQSAERSEEMHYAFVGHGQLSALPATMHRFVARREMPGHDRDSLVVFFEPDSALASHADFVARFWEVLRCLSRADPGPTQQRVPDDPLWEFSFAGCEMFVVGASPTYQHRRSRNLGPGMVLVFQPRNLFIEPKTGQPIKPEVRRALHRRMAAYDGMPVHPDIGFYGEPTNREWKQYVLPDDNTPQTGGCPFHDKRTSRNQAKSGGSRTGEFGAVSAGTQNRNYDVIEN